MNKDDRGQASLEYTLLLLVIVILIFSVLGTVRGRLVGDGVCTPGSEALVCRLQETYSGPSYFGGTFEFFRLRR